MPARAHASARRQCVIARAAARDERHSGVDGLRAVLRRRAFGGTAAKDQSASSSACFRWGHDRFGRDPERAWEHSWSSPAPTRHLLPLATTLPISDPHLRETLSHAHTYLFFALSTTLRKPVQRSPEGAQSRALGGATHLTTGVPNLPEPARSAVALNPRPATRPPMVTLPCGHHPKAARGLYSNSWPTTTEPLTRRRGTIGPGAHGGACHLARSFPDGSSTFLRRSPSDGACPRVLKLWIGR